MIFTAGMGVPETLQPDFNACMKNKQHQGQRLDTMLLEIFCRPNDSMVPQGLWCALDAPELLSHSLAMHCCSEGHSRLEPKVLSSSCVELECLRPHDALELQRDSL